MRRARNTYKVTYHHVMNRGIMGENIFSCDKARYSFFVKYSYLGYLYK